MRAYILYGGLLLVIFVFTVLVIIEYFREGG